jgi:selenocysteine lyase/cysteine desulfurase
MERLAAHRGGAGIRLSVAHYNTKAELDAAMACVAKLAGRAARRSTS